MWTDRRALVEGVAEYIDDVGCLSRWSEFVSHQGDGTLSHALKFFVAEQVEDVFKLSREGDDLSVVDRYRDVGCHVDAPTPSMKADDNTTRGRCLKGRKAKAFTLVEREKHCRAAKYRCGFFLRHVVYRG